MKKISKKFILLFWLYFVTVLAALQLSIIYDFVFSTTYFMENIMGVRNVLLAIVANIIVVKIIIKLCRKKEIYADIYSLKLAKSPIELTEEEMEMF